jgi:hypothetical protein
LDPNGLKYSILHYFWILQYSPQYFKKAELPNGASNTVRKTAVFLILWFPKPPYLLDPNGLVFNTSLFLDTAVFPTILKKIRAPKRGLTFRRIFNLRIKHGLRTKKKS